MSKTLFMMKGLPACGKSTWARDYITAHGNAKRVNKDDLRAMLDTGKWSKDNEKFLLGVRDSIVIAALDSGKHVIVDDTNLAPKHEERLSQLAREHGAVFEVVDLTGVTVEECIERDRKRANYVGEKVIRDMYDQFLRKPVAVPPRDPELPYAILVDIDGTVAQMNGRGPFEWHRVGEDLPRLHVFNAAAGLQDQFEGTMEMIFMSGRDESCRQLTLDWIKEHLDSTEHPLFMRPAGDMRKDSIVKRELYEAHIKGKYNVYAIFDDRPQMIREWQALGFADRLFNVGDSREF